jgi:hypothetical protein
METGLSILITMYPVSDQRLERDGLNQKLFCCMRRMSSEIGKFKICFWEGLTMEGKHHTKRFLEGIVGRKGKNELEYIDEEFEPLLK